MPEGLETVASVYHRALVQILRDVFEEGMQHPKREGLVDRDQYDDGCRQVDFIFARENNEDYHTAEFDACMTKAVSETVRKQVEAGIDIVAN